MLADMLSATRLPECHRTRHVDVRPVGLANANIPRRVNSLRVQVKVTRIAVTSCANGESTVFGVLFAPITRSKPRTFLAWLRLFRVWNSPFEGVADGATATHGKSFWKVHGR
jgi:hypothetical protein